MKTTLTFALMFVAAAAIADELQPASVVVFKNGLAFVQEEGAVAVRGGEAEIDAPDAVFGSIWLRADGKPDAIGDVVAHHVPSADQRPALTLSELLDANIGREVTLRLGESLEARGTILQTPRAPASTSIAISRVRSVYGGDQGQTASEPSFLLLQTAEGVRAIPRADIRNATFAETPAILFTPQGQSARLRVALRGKPSRLNLAYLTRNLGWSGEYQLRLATDTTAELTMKALLVNDAIDLPDTEVFFAVGVPSFQFRGVRSPLSVRDSLAEFFNALQSGGSEGDSASMVNANVMSQSAMRTVGAANDGAMSDVALRGSSNEDLFLYRQPDVKLLRGERGSYRVFTATVPVRHMYTWTVANPADVPYGQRNAPTPPEQRVWHVVRLTNGTEVPWTTAPALVVSEGGQAIAQNTLEYTARGGTSDLRLTAASDVAAFADEQQIERQPDAREFSGYQHDAVVIEGRLRVQSYKTAPIALSITKIVPGEVVSSSDDAASVKLADNPTQLNASSKLSWEIDLAPGEEKIVTYRYRVFVRH